MQRRRSLLVVGILFWLKEAWTFRGIAVQKPLKRFTPSTLHFQVPTFSADLLLLTGISDAMNDLKDRIDRLPLISYNDIQNAAIVGAGLTYLAVENRPRGSVRDDLVEVRKSTTIKNNLGVFSKTFIPEGTVIGTYPGFIRSMDNVYKNKLNDAARSSAARYLWETESRNVLDPTNTRGLVDLELNYLFGLKKVSTTLARLNEPPKGSDVNCIVKVSGSTVTITAERNIFSNEELFIDYGPSFDRSDYPRNQESPVSTTRNTDTINIKLQPIVSSSDSTDGAPTMAPSTTKKDGFLNQLAQKDAIYASSGILSPTEASKRFSTQGEALFASSEDQELIDSLYGKPTASGGEAKAVTTDAAGTRREEPTGRGVDNIFGVTAQLASSSAKDAVLDVETDRAAPSQRRGPRTSVFEQRRTNSRDPSSDESSPTAGVTEIAPQQGASSSVARPSPEQVDALQRKLDSLSDEEVKAVFKRLRSSSMETLVQQGLQQYRQQKAGRMAGGVVASPTDLDFASDVGAAQLPASVPPVDAGSGELGQVEQVLQELSSDPMAVWRELVLHPEKYVDEDGNPLPLD